MRETLNILSLGGIYITCVNIFICWFRNAWSLINTVSNLKPSAFHTRRCRSVPVGLRREKTQSAPWTAPKVTLSLLVWSPVSVLHAVWMWILQVRQHKTLQAGPAVDVAVQLETSCPVLVMVSLLVPSLPQGELSAGGLRSWKGSLQAYGCLLRLSVLTERRLLSGNNESISFTVLSVKPF